MDVGSPVPDGPHVLDIQGNITPKEVPIAFFCNSFRIFFFLSEISTEHN